MLIVCGSKISPPMAASPAYPDHFLHWFVSTKSEDVGKSVIGGP